jgi:biopolymer transport protein TolR
MGADLGTKSGPIADINVTPLIDVVLVLLVVFRVITPMLSSGLQVDLPLATTTVTVNDVGQHIVISVTKEGTWAVDQTRIAALPADATPEQETARADEVLLAIRTSLAENNERTILVKADRSIKYGDIRKVLDILSANNFTAVFIAAGKEK